MTATTRRYGQREVLSTAGVIKINSEIAVLKKLMLMAQCWTPELAMYYLPFKQQEPVQRALSAEEQARFLSTAASSPALASCSLVCAGGIASHVFER